MKDANETEIGLGGRTFGFSLYEADSTFQVSGAPIETTNSTTKATVNFKSIQFTKSMIDAQPNGDFYYVIKEENAGKTADGVTNWDGQVNIKLHAEVVNDSVVFKAEYYRYQSAEDMEAGKTDNTVRLIDVAGEEFTLGRVFNHYNAQAEVQLGAKKLLDGKAPKNDQFRFTLTEVADKDGTPITPAEGKQVYTDTKTNDAEGNVVFDKIRYAAFDAGTNANGAKRYYKITEEQNGAQGIDYDSASYVVTVTIQDDGKGNLTAVPDKSAEDIVFNNTTQTGKLQLKKTILGDITEEEAEGALTFTVKNEDGKYLDKDGNLSDTEVKLTLKDFDHKKGTKEYTLEFQGIKVGDYTVTETTKDITGKDVTVAYKLNGGETQTGVEATAGVTKNETTTVAFEDDYTDQTGNLQLTKTIQGDVTEAEAEGALTFTVKNKDGKYLDKDGNLSDTEVKLTLKDFDHKEGTKEYTLEFKGIKVGNYTVTETTKDITGKDVTVSYKLNGGEAQTGAEATAGVTKNETTTVAFEDDYADQTGNLQLKKTILGDITEEEAEGALKFTVQNEDGKYLDKDGNLSDTEVKLTLKDFDHKEGTKEYTLEFQGIKVGDYTVTETTKDITGKDVTVSYKLNDGEAQTGAEATAGVTKDKTTTVAFEDDYTDQTGNLQLTKTIQGDITEEEAEGALTFEVTTGKDADQKWLDKNGKLSDTKVELTLKDFSHKEGSKEYTLEFKGIKVGNYTVTETTKDITGKDVTVSYKLNGGEAQTGAEATAGVTKNETTTVAFEDDYTDQTGNLQLKKTIQGDITEEEAEGALTFEVTTADGKWLDKDGKLSDSEVVLTLKDFAHEEGTKEYTLSFEGIRIGDYTVKETTKDIDGKDVAVSYTIDNGQKQTGTSAEATVTKGDTVAVAFEDDYTNQTETQTGNLQLKKTIKGDVTEEEAE